MQRIGDRISFVDHTTKTTLIILPKKQPWVIALMGAWLAMWLCIGLITIWSLWVFQLKQQEKIILWIFLSFWLYYSIKVSRAFLWLIYGEERLKIDETGLHIKNSFRNYGKNATYYFENIQNMTYDIPKEKSFQSVWESSPWVNGAERFYFEYFSKIIKFGKKLTSKEAHLLSQVLEKRMRKFSKK